MKSIILFFIIPFMLFAKTSFITPKEYALQLYKNPRGIGCDHCHGEKGEGKIIAHYQHRGKERSFGGPKIDKLKFSTFYKALNKRTKGMPRYFLTQKEIKALFLYVTTYKNIQREKNE